MIKVYKSFFTVESLNDDLGHPCVYVPLRNLMFYLMSYRLLIISG